MNRLPSIVTRVCTGWFADSSIAVEEGGRAFCEGENFEMGVWPRMWTVEEGGSHVVTPPTREVVLVKGGLRGFESLPSDILCSFGGAGTEWLTEVEELRVVMGTNVGGRRRVLVPFVEAAALDFSSWQFCNIYIKDYIRTAKY